MKRLLRLSGSLLLLLTAYSGFAADTKPIYRGWAIKDCGCLAQSFDETPGPHAIRKGAFVGNLCKAEGEKVACGNGFAKTIRCPKSCIELRKTPPLSREENQKHVSKVVSQSAQAAYTAKVPSLILKAIRKTYPAWLPALYNEQDPYIADFKLLESFYFEIPSNALNQKHDVSIVYFFQDLDHLLKRKMNWSFWNTITGELLHDSIAPYPIFDGAYVNQPCLAPSGPNHATVVLSGISAGPSDAGGCCGPYSLKELKAKGPLLIPEGEPGYDRDDIYSVCDRSVRFKTVNGKQERREK